jgi:hypothetical protein
MPQRFRIEVPKGEELEIFLKDLKSDPDMKLIRQEDLGDKVAVTYDDIAASDLPDEPQGGGGSSGGATAASTASGGFGPGPFKVKAPLVMKQLLKDFPEFNKVHAAAILGNIFVESAGFTAFHEKGLPFEKGGIGWCQWTGRPGRRQDFEKFCDTEKLEIRSDEASYKFMVHEMRSTPEKAVVKPLSLMTDLNEATEFFMKKYERPGAPHLAQRQNGAKIALDAFDTGG